MGVGVSDVGSWTFYIRQGVSKPYSPAGRKADEAYFDGCHFVGDSAYEFDVAGLIFERWVHDTDLESLRR